VAPVDLTVGPAIEKGLLPDGFLSAGLSGGAVMLKICMGTTRELKLYSKQNRE
jgi:hypothetical protein